MQPSKDQKSAMLKRLARVEGQIRGLQRLIDSDEDCEKVAQQMTAARKALDRAFYEMMACMVESAIRDAHQEDEAILEARRLLSKYA